MDHAVCSVQCALCSGECNLNVDFSVCSENSSVCKKAFAVSTVDRTVLSVQFSVQCEL